MEKVYITNYKRKVDINYRLAVCACLPSFWCIAFQEDVTDFQCPNCGEHYHTNGPRDWIIRVSS